MPKLYDLEGQEFNSLKVIKKCDGSFDNQIYWECQCRCGKVIKVSTRNLRSGKVKSCGCTKRALIAEKKKTHGMTGTRIFRIWSGMLLRCYTPSSSGYEYYGGRGITVCDEWRENFQAFYDWSMENGYKDDLTIDRKDNEKGYSPDNCKWATSKEQANNRRNNRYIEFNGKVHTISEWEQITGISRRVIEERIDNLGWSIERALTQKVHTAPIIEKKLDRQLERIKREHK